MPIKIFFVKTHTFTEKIMKKITTLLISMFRGHKFREYDTFTKITWNIKSQKKFFIGKLTPTATNNI